MADKQVIFQIKVTGNAEAQLKTISKAAEQTKTKFEKLGDFSLRLNNIYLVAAAAISKVASAVKDMNAAYNVQIEAEAKLSQVMHNTMGAAQAQVDSIKALTAAQQQLGVVGDEVQLAGAQELATYLTKTESLKTLIPVMNDMLAQQYGLNATQEQAAQIAAMLGKVMDGQVGALSRYGYKFDKAQEKILKFGTEEQRVATLAEVVTSAVGGVNRRMALTNAGRAKQLANNFGDLKEQLGQLGQIAAQKVLPVASKLLGVVQNWVAVNPVLVIAREKAELNALVGSLTQTNLKEDERKRVIDEIQAKYPDFLGNLDAEKATTEELRDRLKEVNKEYDKRMRKAAYNRMLDKLNEDYADEMDTWAKYNTSIEARKQMKDLYARGKKFASSLAGVDGAQVNFMAGVVQDKNRQKIGLNPNQQATFNAMLEEYRALNELISGKLDGYDEEKLKKAEATAKAFQQRRQTLQKIIDDEFGPEEEASGTGTVTPNATADETKANVRKGVEAATTGGTRNTTVNITIGQMKGVETLNVDSLEQGVADLEQRLAEAMSRVLGMAEMSVA